MYLVLTMLCFSVMLVQLHKRKQFGTFRLMLHDKDAVILLPIAEHRGSVDGAQRIEFDELYQGVEFFTSLVLAKFFEDGSADFRHAKGIHIQMHHELGVIGDIGLVNFCRLHGGNRYGQGHDAE